MKPLASILIALLLSSAATAQTQMVDLGCSWDDPESYEGKLLSNETWIMHYGIYWWSGNQLKSYTWSYDSASSFANAHDPSLQITANLPGWNGEPLSHWKVEISRQATSIKPVFHTEASDESEYYRVTGMAYGTLEYNAATFSWEPEHADDMKLFLGITPL